MAVPFDSSQDEITGNHSLDGALLFPVSVDLRDAIQGGANCAIPEYHPDFLKILQLYAAFNNAAAKENGVRLAGAEIGGGAYPQIHTMLGRQSLLGPEKVGQIIKDHFPAESFFVRPLERGDYVFGTSINHPDVVYWMIGTYAKAFGSTIEYDEATGAPNNNPVETRLRLFTAQNDISEIAAALDAIIRIRKDGFVDEVARDPATGVPPAPVFLNLTCQIDLVFTEDDRLDERYYGSVAAAIGALVEKHKDAHPDILAQILKAFGIKDMTGGLTAPRASAITNILMQQALRQNAATANHSHELGDAVAAIAASAKTAQAAKQAHYFDVSLVKKNGFAYLPDVVNAIAAFVPGYRLTPEQKTILEQIAALTHSLKQEYKSSYVPTDYLSPWQIKYGRLAQGGVPSYMNYVVDSGTARTWATIHYGAEAKNPAHLEAARRLITDVSIHVNRQIADDLTAHAVTPAMLFMNNLTTQVLMRLITADRGAFIRDLLAKQVDLMAPLPNHWKQRIRDGYDSLSHSKACRYFVRTMPLDQEEKVLKAMRLAILDEILPVESANRQIFKSAYLTPQNYGLLRQGLKDRILDKDGATQFMRALLGHTAGCDAEITAVTDKYIGIDVTPANADVPNRLPDYIAMARSMQQQGRLHPSLSLQQAVFNLVTYHNENPAAALRACQFPSRYYPHLYPEKDVFNLTPDEIEIARRWRAIDPNYAGKPARTFDELQRHHPQRAYEIKLLYKSLPRDRREAMTIACAKEIGMALRNDSRQAAYLSERFARPVRLFGNNTPPWQPGTT